MESASRRSSGTHQGLRQQLPWSQNRLFRILSIDGGGIKGILPATVLATFEERYLSGRSAGDYFDLIAGTSTGGIIALGLALGLPAKAILDLYLEHGAEVFPPIGWDLGGLRRKLRFARSLRHHRYDREPLQRHLKAVFGAAILGDTQRRLCVPAFDGFTKVHIFKTPHHPDYRLDWREELITVALATAAAPTFFSVYKDRGRFFADGGVWANNPVMIGLVDALACYDLARRQVWILSLGCGDTEMAITKGQILRGGIWHWREIISSAMHLQSQNANGQAGLLIGRDHLFRINAPPNPENPIEMDDFRRARAELPAIAHRRADEFGDAVADRFFHSPADPYKAHYGPRALTVSPSQS